MNGRRLVVLLALAGLGALVYGLPGALVGYVVGLLVAPFLPAGRGACTTGDPAAARDRDVPVDEGGSPSDADAA